VRGNSCRAAGGLELVQCFTFGLTVFVRIVGAEGHYVACFEYEAVAQDTANIVSQQVKGDGEFITCGDDPVNLTIGRDQLVERAHFEVIFDRKLCKAASWRSPCPSHRFPGAGMWSLLRLLVCYARHQPPHPPRFTAIPREPQNLFCAE
jgi:hypothetical protein